MDNKTGIALAVPLVVEILLPVAGCALAYVYILKPLLVSFGVLKDAAASKIAADTSTALNAAASKANASNPATLTAYQALNLADKIHADCNGFPYVATDYDGAVDCLKQCTNDADVYALISAYGIRPASWSGIGNADYGLSAFLTSNMPDARVQEVRDYYKSIGITVII